MSGGDVPPSANAYILFDVVGSCVDSPGVGVDVSCVEAERESEASSFVCEKRV